MPLLLGPLLLILPTGVIQPLFGTREGQRAPLIPFDRSEATKVLQRLQDHDTKLLDLEAAVQRLSAALKLLDSHQSPALVAGNSPSAAAGAPARLRPVISSATSSFQVMLRATRRVEQFI